MVKISKHALLRIEERQNKQWIDNLSNFQFMLENIPYKAYCLNYCKEFSWNYYPDKKKNQYLRYLTKHKRMRYKKKKYYIYKNYMWIFNPEDTVLITMYPVMSYGEWLIQRKNLN